MGEVLVAAHRSWSQVSAYNTCGHRFLLERLQKVPQRPSWAALGGKAFHVATEKVDRDGLDPEVAWTQAWNDEFDLQTKHAEYPQDQWYAGGRASKAWPNKETGAWWLANGPQLVKDYATWRDTNSDWKIMDVAWKRDILTEEGDHDYDFNMEPAIEWGATVWFGSTPVKAFIDRVFVNPDGEAVIVDLKTGSWTPEPHQLGWYACVMEKAGLPRPRLGAFYKARTATLTPAVDLDWFTVDLFRQQLDTLERGVEHGVFPPNIGSTLCGSCSVREWCVPMGGREFNPMEHIEGNAT